MKLDCLFLSICLYRMSSETGSDTCRMYSISFIQIGHMVSFIVDDPSLTTNEITRRSCNFLRVFFRVMKALLWTPWPFSHYYFVHRSCDKSSFPYMYLKASGYSVLQELSSLYLLSSTAAFKRNIEIVDDYRNISLYIYVIVAMAELFNAPTQ